MLRSLAAAANAARLWNWYDRRIWKVALLCVLGYAWLIVGFPSRSGCERACFLLPPDVHRRRIGSPYAWHDVAVSLGHRSALCR